MAPVCAEAEVLILLWDACIIMVQRAKQISPDAAQSAAVALPVLSALWL